MNRITTRILVLALGLGGLITAGPGCNSSDGCQTGAVKCACFPNKTCNTGLSCASDICVAAVSQDAAPEAAPAVDAAVEQPSPSPSPTPSPTPTPGVCKTATPEGKCAGMSGTSVCDKCTLGCCCDDFVVCRDTENCATTVSCLLNCPANDNACVTACKNKYPAAYDTAMKQYQCLFKQCTKEC